MVRRVGKSSRSNCRLEIPTDIKPRGERSGVFLELIATRDIMTGQVLLLDLPPPSSASLMAGNSKKKEEELLKQELKLVGMPYDDNFFVDESIEEDDVNDDAHVLQQHNDGEDDTRLGKEL